MLRIRPFAAWRPPTEPRDTAAEVACVPYDVISTAEARDLARDKDRSFLHVIRPELALPDTTDPYSDAVYALGKSNFDRFRASGVLRREETPSVYLYRQEMTLLGRRIGQTGVVACCHVDDYASNLIKKHEKTRKDKEDDRTRHVVELNANAEPVFFMHRDREDIAALVAKDASARPLYDFTAPDGIRHIVWRVADAGAYVRAFAAVPEAYVADGHHRTASAARAGALRRAANPEHTGDEAYNWFMAVLFPASSLTILPYHRVVKDLNGLNAAQVLERLRGVGMVEPTERPEPPVRGTFCVYLGKAAPGGGWHRVTFPAGSIPVNDPIASLDYVLLSERVLGPVFGVGDLRTDKRIDFVGGIRGPAELERRVDSGSAGAAFCMHPVEIGQVMAVADAGEIMPPKSTWFEPKLRSGLLVNTLD